VSYTDTKITGPLLHSTPASTQGLILIVGDDLSWGDALDTVCDFFDLAVEHVPSEVDVGVLLREFRPMAVIAEVDGRGQDGYHVMKVVANHDPSLPFMLLADDNPALHGAADAVKELTGLTNCRISTGLPPLAGLVDFLFQAGRRAGIGRMMPINHQV
jgi:hypothetical protein